MIAKGLETFCPRSEKSGKKVLHRKKLLNTKIKLLKPLEKCLPNGRKFILNVQN